MFHSRISRLALAGPLLMVASLLAACESDVERQMRLEREKLEETGELEELEEQLDTTNPDPYDPTNAGTINRGRFKQD